MKLQLEVFLNYGLELHQAANVTLHDNTFIVALNGAIPVIEAIFKYKPQNIAFLKAIIAREVASFCSHNHVAAKKIAHGLFVDGNKNEIADRIFAFLLQELMTPDEVQMGTLPIIDQDTTYSGEETFPSAEKLLDDEIKEFLDIKDDDEAA
jgi:hypothetical protein